MAQVMRKLIFALLLIFATSFLRGYASFSTFRKKSTNDSLLHISAGQPSNKMFSDNHTFSNRNVSESIRHVQIPALYKSIHHGKHYSSNITAAVCESKCGENERCVIVDGQSTCLCSENFARRNATSKCEACDCGGDGHICSFNFWGVKRCQCKDRYIYDETITQKCIVDCDSCGINEVCSLVNDEISCFCRELYVRNNASAECELCYCGEGTKTCGFDEEGEPVCTCTEEFAYEKKRKKCLLPDCASCGRNEGCSLENGEISCFCQELYARRTTNGECEPCSCGEGSKSCSFNRRGDPDCSCKVKYKSVYVEQKYECWLDCSSCGKNEVCSLVNDEITCFCQHLYAKKNGSEECESCSCGRDETESCEFDEEGKNVCTCKEKYAFFEDSVTRTCVSCDCGPNGECYTFGNRFTMRRSCSCYKGYERRDTYCYPCDCGKFGSCSFDSSNKKTCKCYSGYQWENVQEGKCLLCDCGQYGNCSFRNAEKHCQCQKGYEVNSHKEYKCRPCDCGRGGSCEYIRGNKFCRCETGYSLINSEMCEECQCGYYSVDCYFKDRKKVCSCHPGYIDINGTCGECDCGGNDNECSLTSEGEKQCQCKEGFVYDDRRGQICLECDCGGFGNVCNFTYNGDKECQCKEGYSYNERRGQKCIECDCGGNDHSCHFNSEGGKWCQCKEGYSYDEGRSQICRECSCGPNSTECFLQDEMKLCVCNPGYQDVNGICQECDCGGSAHACSFTSEGEKQCQCGEGYAYDEGKDKKCIECRCGVNSTGCYFNDEKKFCICNPGYQDENGTCQVIEVFSTDDNIGYSTPFTTKQTTEVSETSSTEEITELTIPITTMPTTQAFTTSKITESPTTQSVGSTSPGLIECDCGEYGRCVLDVGGGKHCICVQGYEIHNGKCRECDCGPNGKCFLNKYGDKMCICFHGYRERNGRCLPNEYWFELWFAAFTIAAIIGGLVTVNIIISCCALRRSRKV